jgi:hypothetical protein
MMTDEPFGRRNLFSTLLDRRNDGICKTQEGHFLPLIYINGPYIPMNNRYNTW